MRLHLLGIVSLLVTSAATSQLQRTVDFRYAPAYSFSVIGFPDDWEKTVVTTKGTLGYNFGPGPYAKPLTEVGIGVEGAELRVQRQYFSDPRIPIAVTEFTSAAGNVRQEAFALVPPAMSSYAGNTFLNGKVQRLDGLNGAFAWALPSGRKDPAFRNIAWGVNRPIHYRVKVAAGSRKIVALGFAESYKPRPGMRILDLRVEGAEPQVLDPMQDKIQNQTYVLLFNGRDANNDGMLNIEVRATENSDPNVFLNVIWVFPVDAKVTTDQIISGEASSKAELYYDCGPEGEVYAPYPRTDALRATFASDTASPVILINSHRSFAFDEKSGRVTADGHPFLIAKPRPITFTSNAGQWLLHLPKGTMNVEVIVIHGGAAADTVNVMPDLEEKKAGAIKYWQRADLPQGKILVPDSGIQYILDANIRNMYQIRELVDGYLQFQPGPSVYRGLWIHDAAWHVDAATMLGDTLSAKRVVDNILRYQQPDGRLRIMSPIDMQSETPAFVYLLCRYAQLTHNAAWLNQHWKHVADGIAWVQPQRNSTLSDSTEPYAGLLPPGFADGGLGGKTAEYSGVFTGLIGVKTAIKSAHWLGKEEDARSWQKFYDAFLSTFLRAAKRDMRKDAYGNWYLPLKMADTSSSTPPHRAQWAFVQLQNQGHVFDIHDSLVVNAFRMLQMDAQEGLAPSVGWVQGGVWPFFSSIHGMGDLWQRNYTHAANLLYAVSNHASTLGTWVEEQQPRAVGTRTSGDASNATASSLFIAFVRKSIALERDSTLELLAGVPEEWFRPHATIALNNVLTEFGPLTFRMQVDSGNKATIDVSSVRGNGVAGGPVIFLQKLKQLGYLNNDGSPVPDTYKGSWGKEIHLTLVKK